MKQLPDWVQSTIGRGVDHLESTDRVLHLCISGIDKVSRMPNLIEALLEVDRKNHDTKLEKRLKILDRSKLDAEFAKKEIDDGFPILHAHSTIALWSVLESVIFDLAVAWLLNIPETLKNPAFAKIKIPIVQYESLSNGERVEYIAKEMIRIQEADFKLGIGKFECMLEPLALNGPVSEMTRKTLLEFSQVRNVLVHRAGIVDGRLLSVCPWFTVPLGSRLRISHEDYHRYSEATSEYLLDVIFRAHDYFGTQVDRRSIKSSKRDNIVIEDNSAAG